MNDKQISELFALCKEFDLVIKDHGYMSGKRFLVPEVEENKALINKLDKVFLNLELALSSDAASFLPYINNADGAEASLIEDVSQCINSLRRQFPDGVISRMERIATYLLKNGVWGSDLRRASEAMLKEARKNYAELSSISERARKALEEAEGKIKDLDAIKDAMEKNSVSSANKVSKLSSEAAVKLAEIESKYSSFVVYVEEAPKVISEAKNELNDLKVMISAENRAISDLEGLREDVLKRRREVEEAVGKAIQEITRGVEYSESAKTTVEQATDAIRSKESYFDERNRYLDDLIGREVGASLFETFKQRKIEISHSIGFWKWAVASVTAVAVVWIFFLFGWKSTPDLSWQLILINTIKTAPVVGLLLFTIAQYSKERNFQEEYAFKSAVALTVNSYASQLDDKENKDRLVMDSVSEIYQSPLPKSSVPVKPKELSGVMKDLSEAAKALKG